MPLTLARLRWFSSSQKYSPEVPPGMDLTIINNATGDCPQHQELGISGIEKDGYLFVDNRL
jgi:hypothetical protein